MGAGDDLRSVLFSFGGSWVTRGGGTVVRGNGVGGADVSSMHGIFNTVRNSWKAICICIACVATGIGQLDAATEKLGQFNKRSHRGGPLVPLFLSYPSI